VFVPPRACLCCRPVFVCLFICPFLRLVRAAVAPGAGPDCAEAAGGKQGQARGGTEGTLFAPGVFFACLRGERTAAAAAVGVALGNRSLPKFEAVGDIFPPDGGRTRWVGGFSPLGLARGEIVERMEGDRRKNGATCDGMQKAPRMRNGKNVMTG